MPSDFTREDYEHAARAAAAHSSFFGRQRSMSLRSASMPPAVSIFSHCLALSRIDRCSRRSSGGTGGRPRGFFSSVFMSRLCVIHKVLAHPYLLNHNKSNATTPEIIMARALGTDDGITTCDCCGKSGLKFTVAIEMDDGEVVHYGQVCARRNTGKDQRTIASEMKAHKDAQRAAARREFFACDAYLAERSRYAERDSLPFGDARRLGIAASEFVRDASDAADHACAEIARRYGVSTWDVRL